MSTDKPKTTGDGMYTKTPAPTATAQTPGTGIEADIATVDRRVLTSPSCVYQAFGRLASAARDSITLAEENKRMREAIDSVMAIRFSPHTIVPLEPPELQARVEGRDRMLREVRNMLALAARSTETERGS